MKAHIKLGRILGMEVGLHLSWFIIAFLIIMENANELPVAKDGRIEGFLTRGGVMRLLQTRLALEM